MLNNSTLSVIGAIYSLNTDGFKILPVGVTTGNLRTLKLKYVYWLYYCKYNDIKLHQALK